MSVASKSNRSHQQDDEASLSSAIAAAEKFQKLATQDAYSKMKSEREKATFAMMMKMNPAALTNIRKEFFSRQDSITLEEFMYIIQKHLINRPGDDTFIMETPEQRDFGSNMFELFKDIDVNGDGQLEWQEFTAFTVEKANILNKRAKLTSIAHYHDSSPSLDPTATYRHRHDISRFINIPSLGMFAMVEDHRNAIFAFNSRSGKLLSTIATDAAPIAIEQMHTKDGVSLITSGADMTLSTYSLDDPNPKRRFKTMSTWATPAVQMSIAYSPENKLLYSGAVNGNIYSWNVKDRSMVTQLNSHEDIVMNLIHLEKLNNIASASLDKTLAIWDSHTNEEVLRLHGHKKGVFDLTYSPSYRLLVSCGFEHDACVWSPFVKSLVYRLKGHHASLVGCTTVENSPEIITADTSGVFKLWDVRNFQCVQTFSANLSGADTKDSSKLTSFFHTKLPSHSQQQKEDDSRIYAASKMVFSFDQARVVHEATTDYSNVLWVTYSDKNSCIVTASQRNVIVWDALIGSRVFTHVNICEEEISACCLDDRERKIIIGDVKGNISVYNLSSGALMKQAPPREAPCTVVSLQYYDEVKRLLVGFQDGTMTIYDEALQDDILVIRSFEHFNIHEELLTLQFNCYNQTAVTAGTTDAAVKVWNYNSGKCDLEMYPCNGEPGHICSVTSLLPYPLIATSDSFGNIVVWGTSNIKWQGMRITGFANMTPGTAIYETQIFEEDAPPRRALAPAERRRLDWAKSTIVLDHEDDDDNASLDSSCTGDSMSLDSQSTFSKANPPVFLRHQSTRMASTRNMKTDMEEVDRLLQDEARIAADNMTKESEEKWGKVAPAQAMCWKEADHTKKKLILCGDDLGWIRCFSITDALSDVRASELMTEPYASQRINGSCRKMRRTNHSAVAPVRQDGVGYLLGKDKDAMSYLGVEFCWALHGHNDRIISCTAIETGFVTSAADKLVRIWNFDGLPMGVLLQSVPVGSRSRNWDLNLDVHEFIRREQEQLDEIIDSTTEFAKSGDKPNIHAIDFSGMEIGAESAAFAQSVLRQRIEKTGERLGLNFPTSAAPASSGSIDNSGSFVSGGASLEEFSTADMTAAPLVGGLNGGGSLASSATKSLDDALKELKSPASAVDYALKTKQMSHIQRKRKQHKMESIADQFESISGVKLGASTRAGVGSDMPGNGDLSQGSGSVGETKKDIDQELLSLSGNQEEHKMLTPKHSHSNVLATDSVNGAGGGVEAGLSMVTGSMGESLDTRDGIGMSRGKSGGGGRPPKYAGTASKIALSLKQAHDNGARTQSMLKSCKQHKAYEALEDALQAHKTRGAADVSAGPSDAERQEMRQQRERKQNMLLNHSNSLSSLRQRTGVRSLNSTPFASKPSTTSGGAVASSSASASGGLGPTTTDVEPADAATRTFRPEHSTTGVPEVPVLASGAAAAANNAEVFTATVPDPPTVEATSSRSNSISGNSNKSDTTPAYPPIIEEAARNTAH